ncbi:MAG: glycoside hydrolase family 20 zincin-like fold domain-containing protein [Bacteroidota bacterium]
MNRAPLLLLFVAVLAFTISCKKEGNKSPDQVINIIPSPNKILKRSGSIQYDKNFRVIADVSDSSSSIIATYLVNELEEIFNTEILISDLFSTRKYSQSIQLEILNDVQSGQELESYKLDITSNQIKISASSPIGIYYGIQSLLQILDQSYLNDISFTIPKMIIKDTPQLSVRGVLVTQSFLKEIIESGLVDHLSKLKLNSIYVSNYSSLIDTLGTAYPYLKFKDGQTLADNIPVISIDLDNAISQDLSQLLSGNKINGLVLKISSSSTGDFEKEIELFAESCWSNN